jgi:hypothetical protein
MKQLIVNHLKNLFGWKTRRKIVVFSVDDYGNVRVDSKKARENMDKAGLRTESRFDAYDTLETREDLEMLCETLSSVKDANGRHAVFTPFALPCNINFEQMAAENYTRYRYETLPQTYEKLAALQPAAYEGAWAMWQESIARGLMAPQFHGREHFNLKVFEEKLQRRDPELLTALQNRSFTSLSDGDYPTIAYTAAFDFWDVSENERLQSVITDGLQRFAEVYGYRAVHFMPPTSKIHPMHYGLLFREGIRYIDINPIHRQHMGSGLYQRSLNYTGKPTAAGQALMVRNVVFEPTVARADDRGFDWVNHTLGQIEAAFRMKSPAIISSHRVNFCGHIDPKNRAKGIAALKELLHRLTKKWPDVHFMSANELGNLITAKTA